MRSPACGVRTLDFDLVVLGRGVCAWMSNAKKGDRDKDQCACNWVASWPMSIEVRDRYTGEAPSAAYS